MSCRSGHGIVGALLSGVMAASAITGVSVLRQTVGAAGRAEASSALGGDAPAVDAVL